MEQLLLRGGHVISLDPEIGDVPDGDVLVREGRIAYAGPRLREDVRAQVVPTDGQIVIPGMVDGHRHTWESLLRGISVDWTFANYYEGLRTVIARH